MRLVLAGTSASRGAKPHDLTETALRGWVEKAEAGLGAPSVGVLATEEPSSATVILDSAPMEPDVARLIEQKERYEQAFDAARVAFHAALRDDAPARVVLQLPAASPPSPSKSGRQATLVAAFNARLAELREPHAAAPNPSTQGELDRLWQDHHHALQALDSEPATEGPHPRTSPPSPLPSRRPLRRTPPSKVALLACNRTPIRPRSSSRSS